MVSNQPLSDMSFKVSSFLAAIFFCCFANSAFAQFNTRFRFEVKASGAMPIYTDNFLMDLDRNPYVFPNFQYGFGGSLGLSYRINKKFDLGLQYSSFSFLDWKDPMIKNSVKSDLLEEKKYGEGDENFTINAWSIVGKYEFKPDARLGFFVQSQIGIYRYSASLPSRVNYLDREEQDPNSPLVEELFVEIRYNPRSVPASTAFGLGAGMGLNYQMSSKMTLFVLGNFQWIYTDKNPQMKLSTQFAEISTGVRFNVFKKRSLF